LYYFNWQLLLFYQSPSDLSIHLIILCLLSSSSCASCIEQMITLTTTSHGQGQVTVTTASLPCTISVERPAYRICGRSTNISLDLFKKKLKTFLFDTDAHQSIRDFMTVVLYKFTFTLPYHTICCTCEFVLYKCHYCYYYYTHIAVLHT